MLLLLPVDSTPPPLGLEGAGVKGNSSGGGSYKYVL